MEEALITNGYYSSLYYFMKNLLLKCCSKSTLESIHRIKGIKYRINMIIQHHKMFVSCPCCGLRFNDFVEAGFLNPDKYNLERYQNTRQTVFCPFCHSMPRHRILALWCENHKALLQASNILYFAPEKSMTIWMNRKRVNFTTADLYSTADLKLDIQATGLCDNLYEITKTSHTEKVCLP